MPDFRVRVWSDRPGDDVAVHWANTGAPVVGAVVHPRSLPAGVAALTALPRRVVEIANLPPDAPIRIAMGGESCTVLTPPPPGGELRLLHGCCYHRLDDRGRLAAAYASLRAQDRPHLRIQCGDQLYLDAGELPGGATPFDRTLARYREYWESAEYAPYLRDGALLCTPDDHDFWNDYPFMMPHLARSWSNAWRAHAAAAQSCLLAYQALGNPEGRTWFTLDLGVVSLFVLDHRTRRGTTSRNPPPRLFDRDQRDALLAWSRALTKPGVLVSAMPLFQKPTGKFLLVTTDHNLLAWPGDARQIWRAVETAPCDVLLLAGDVHQGRAVEWRTGAPGAMRQHWEVVASPLRLLSWPIQLPRRVEDPPAGLQLGGGMGRRDWQEVAYATTTDHFVILRFQDEGAAGVRVRLTAHRMPDAVIPPSQRGGRERCELQLSLRREVA